MMRTPKALKAVLRLVLTVVVVGALFYFVDWRQIVAALAQAELSWLLLAYALVIVRRAIEAGQLRRVLQLVGCRLTWFRIFRANALAAFYALFSPGSLIPVAVKWTDLSAATGKRAIVLNAIIYNRLLLDLQPLIIGAGALLWVNPTGEPILTVVACALALLGLVLGLCLYAPWLARATRRASAIIGRILPKSLHGRLDRLLDDLEPFRALSLGRHAELAAIALAALAVGIAARYLIMMSLGFSVPLTTIIWVDAILVVVSHVPITLGNFGVREGLVVAAFALHGVPADLAVAYGLLVYSCRLILALVGAVYQLALFAGWTTMRGPRQDGPPSLAAIGEPATGRAEDRG